MFPKILCIGFSAYRVHTARHSEFLFVPESSLHILHMAHVSFLQRTSKSTHPLPRARLRLWLRVVATLPIQLGTGSGLWCDALCVPSMHGNQKGFKSPDTQEGSNQQRGADLRTHPKPEPPKGAMSVGNRTQAEP